MKPASHPEANRLIYRIRTALTGESVGLETAKLAWQQAEIVARANRDLKQAVAALESGSPLEALLVEATHPRLIETAQSLNHPQAEEWRTRCAVYSWRLPEPIDLVALAGVQAGFGALGDLKEFLYQEYRAAVRAKDSFQAYRIIRLIATRFPEDPSAKEEAAQLSGRLLELAADDLKNAFEHLIPSETPNAILHRYAATGLPLDTSADAALREAIANEAIAENSRFATCAQTVVDEAKTLREKHNWQEVERSYLACDYLLAIHEARGRIDETLRREFEGVATQLSRSRSNFESEISIRNSIAELRDGIAAGRKSRWTANRLEKLRSLEKLALKTSGQMSEDLQNELKEAYAFARRKRLPRWVMLGGGSLCALLLVGWAISERVEKAEDERRNASALAMLQTAERSGQTKTASEALTTFNETIAVVPPDSQLADQAAILEAWLETQRELAAEYASEIGRLGALVNVPDATRDKAAIERVIASAERTREDLASDIGHELDEQFELLRQTWQERLLADQQSRERALSQLEQELALVFKKAHKAKDRSEFLQLKTDAQSRIRDLEAFAAREESSARANQLAALGNAMQTQLGEIEMKWAALDSAWQQLSQSESLENYLSTLERIQSFDILPSDQKAAIDQSLRLKNAYASLIDETLLPPEGPSQQQFSSGQSYRGVQPQLSDEELAYIERLSSLDTFENVYQSTVQYYEGAAEPQNEYTIYLVEPISKSDSQRDASHVSFNFKVRGFDEFGNREPAARDIPFISRSDGSFWGFFYKPSTLSAESAYYSKSIKNTLKLLEGGADRFTLLRQIGELERQTQLAPAFKVFWQQKLIGFMQLHPWKWGLALSPTLQKRADELANLSGGKVSANLWLSTIEQTVPSPEYALLANEPVGELALKEANALADLYERTLKGSFELAGSVLGDARVALREEVERDESLWSINALTGSVDRVSGKLQLTPFAPVLHYQSEDGGDARAIIAKVEFASGLNLSQAPYDKLLPPLLR